MAKTGRNEIKIISGVVILGIMAGLSCQKQEITEWEDSLSYILSTDTVSVIYVHNHQTEKIAELHPLNDEMEGIHFPTLAGSGDSMAIAFLSSIDTSSSQHHLCTVDNNGGNLKVYPYFPDNMDGSPIAREIVFTLPGTSPTKFYVLDIDNERTSDVLVDANVYSPGEGHTLNFKSAACPAFSPDGSRIAFINTGEYIDSTGDYPVIVERTDLAVVDRDGSDYALITGEKETHELSNTTNFSDLCWNYDGTRILVFTSSGTSIEDCYVINVETARIGIVPWSYRTSYSYVSASPTGDTLLLGTKPSSADLYGVEIDSLNLGYEPFRFTSAKVYSEPDWGPGNL